MTSVTSAVYLAIWLMHNLEELGEWIDNGFNCICFYRCLFHSPWYVTVNLESASSSQWKQPFAFTWQGLQNTFNFLPLTYISSLVFGFSFVLSNLDHLPNPRDSPGPLHWCHHAKRAWWAGRNRYPGSLGKTPAHWRWEMCLKKNQGTITLVKFLRDQ